MLLASFERRPQAAATLDGLNISPVDTAKMLLARLTAAKQKELAARLDAALDPEFLQLPPYEREGSGGPPREGGQGRCRREGGR